MGKHIIRKIGFVFLILLFAFAIPLETFAQASLDGGSPGETSPTIQPSSQNAVSTAPSERENDAFAAKTQAGTARPAGQQEPTITPTAGSQGSNYAKGTSPGTAGATKAAPASDLAASAVGCSVGQILGNIVRAGVGAVITSIKNYIAKKIVSKVKTEVVGKAKPVVPVSDTVVQGHTESTQNNTAKLTNKSVGGGDQSILSALAGATDVSWDSIGWCLANATVHYIAQSTINWINSGFQGNPAFVQNPTQFFKDIGDTEAGNFIKGLGAGALCSDFAPKVRIALVNDYMRRTSGTNQSQCTFTKASNNLQGFMNNYKQGGLGSFVELVQNPGNRPQSAYLASQDALNFKLNQKTAQATLEVNASKLFLSWKECPDKTDSNGKVTKDTDHCVTKTPGSVIQSQLDSTLNLPKNRLSVADEFDEVVGALVNQLIKTALSSTLEGDTTGANQFGNQQVTTGDNTSNNNDTSGDNGDTTVDPNQPRPLSVRCVASDFDTDEPITTVQADHSIRFTATPSGLTSSVVTYDWLGGASLPTSTPDRTITVSYAATGTTAISVRVRNAGKAAIARCTAVTIEPADPLIVSCTPDQTTAAPGEVIGWSSTVSGGTGTYTYAWSGEGSLQGSTEQNPTVAYPQTGTKTGTLTVSSGSQNVTAACDASVRVSNDSNNSNNNNSNN